MLATVAILALGGPAYAADMATKAPPAAPVAAPTTWTGFYVGGQLGGATSASRCNVQQSPTTFLFASLPCAGGDAGIYDRSFAGGGRAGYDWQFNTLVVGLVGDWNWMDLNQKFNSTGLSDAPNTAASASSKIDWLASIRGRLGAASNNWLFYLTGGVAFEHTKDNASLIGTCCGGQFTAPQITKTKTGAVAGAGVEVQLTRNLSLTGEVLWVGGFPAASTTSHSANGNWTYTTSFKTESIVLGTVGANWRF